MEYLFQALVVTEIKHGIRHFKAVYRNVYSKLECSLLPRLLYSKLECSLLPRLLGGQGLLE